MEREWTVEIEGEEQSSHRKGELRSTRREAGVRVGSDPWEIRVK